MAVYANFFFWLLPFTGAKLPVLRLIIMWVLALTMFSMQDIPATAKAPAERFTLGAGGRSSGYTPSSS